MADDNAHLEGGESVDLKAVRAQYLAIVGKKPHHSWDADTLLEKIETAKAAPVIEPPAEPVAPPSMVHSSTHTRVLLMCDHVYLPRTPTDHDWSTCSDTIRYEGETDGKRTRLDVHPDLALFLQNRKQAEILDG